MRSQNPADRFNANVRAFQLTGARLAIAQKQVATVDLTMAPFGLTATQAQNALQAVQAFLVSRAQAEMAIYAKEMTAALLRYLASLGASAQ